MKNTSYVVALAAASALILTAVTAGPAAAAPVPATPSSVIVSPADGQTATGALTVFMMTPKKVKISVHYVEVFLLDTDGYEVSRGHTDAAGRVTFSRVPAGDYGILAEPDTGSPYLDFERDDVTVSAGKHEFVVAVMRLGASIAGSVSTPTGTGLANAVVTAQGRTSSLIYTTKTTASGAYTLTGLPTDSYSIQFNSRPYFGASPASRAYTWNFWGDDPAKPGVLRHIWVTEERGPAAQSVVTRVDGVVREGYALTGIVKPQGLTDLRNAPVEVWGDKPGGSFGSQIDATGGSFRELLVAGVYTFKVTGYLDGRGKEYWYTGESTAPSPNAWDAKKVNFTGTAPLTITFISGG